MYVSIREYMGITIEDPTHDMLSGGQKCVAVLCFAKVAWGTLDIE